MPLRQSRFERTTTGAALCYSNTTIQLSPILKLTALPTLCVTNFSQYGIELSLYISEHNFKESFGKPVWFGAVREEFKACTEGVGVIDAPSFAKFEITVREMCAFYYILTTFQQKCW